MKIIFVSREYPPSLRLGGISFYVKTIATQLVKEGHTVHVIAASDNVKVKELYVEDGVNVHRLSGADFYVEKTMSTISRIKNKFRQITCYGSYRRNLAKYLFELNLEIGFDVIEFAEFGAESLFWFQKGVSTKTIIRLHGPTLLDRNTGISSKDLSWLQNKRALDELRLLDQASAITSPSIAMANWIQSNRKVIYPIPSIVENAINYPYWSSKLDKKQSINIIHIVSAGTLVKEKGFNELVEACKELRESHLNIKLSIAGRMGQLGRELLNKSKNDKNYSGWLTIHESLNQGELLGLYNSARICVFPSWWEPFGLVCIEAMATGAIVIGSSEGGMPEIIEDGINGFICKPKIVSLLKEKILECTKLTEADFLKISSVAKQRASEFDVAYILSKQVKYYDSSFDA